MARPILGIVTGNKSNKTVTISVNLRKTHPLYKKGYTRSTKYMAHDEKNEAKLGDKVAISPSRPLSNKKHFVLDKVIARAAVAFKEADAVADIPKEEVTDKAPPAKKAAAKSINTENASKESS